MCVEIGSVLSRLWLTVWWIRSEVSAMQSQPQHVYPNSWALSYPQHCHWQITLQGTCWCLVSSKLWPTLVRWPQKGETKLQNEGQLWMNTSVCFCCGVRLLHTILYSGWHGNMRADLSWLSRYARITQHMNRQHFLFYILYLCDAHNCKILLQS